MGIYLGVPNYDEDIQRLERPPIILNDIDPEENQKVDPVKEFTMTESKGDVIDTLPTCECRLTFGRYNTSSNSSIGNTICPLCHTEVMSQIDRGFKSNVWIKAPEGVRALIRTNALDMLLKAFTQEEFSAIHYLCNTRYEPKNKTSLTYERFKRLGIPRGYNHFVDNFDRIMEHLMSGSVFRPTEFRVKVNKFMQAYRDSIFSYYLPLPSNRSIITELSNKTRYCAEGYVKIIDAARAIYGLTSKQGERYQAVREQNTFKAMVMMVEYREWLDKKVLGSKQGWYRKQIYGSRTGPTYRAVVTSLSGYHDYEELELPWALSIATYHTHLLGMLTREGFTTMEAERYMTQCLGKYDPFMEKLLNRLIDESPFTTLQGKRGLPQLMGRNPTLNLRSIQCFMATKIKTNIHDKTIGISILAISSMNADSTFN